MPVVTQVTAGFAHAQLNGLRGIAIARWQRLVETLVVLIVVDIFLLWLIL